MTPACVPPVTLALAAGRAGASAGTECAGALTRVRGVHDLTHLRGIMHLVHHVEVRCVDPPVAQRAFA
jgi:hypothetical protein